MPGEAGGLQGGDWDNPSPKVIQHLGSSLGLWAELGFITVGKRRDGVVQGAGEHQGSGSPGTE